MNNSIDTISYASSFTANFSLWLAIVIGVIASVLVLQAAHKMGGGLFGSVLKFMGIGMLLVSIGTIFIAVPAGILSTSFLSLAHTVFFSIGFVCMVLGANKLLKGIMQ